jgi:hypothetical protein
MVMVGIFLHVIFANEVGVRHVGMCSQW